MFRLKPLECLGIRLMHWKLFGFVGINNYNQSLQF